jgi:uncharacterized protein YfaS (alpha-2-macroglobulin family)
LILPGTNLEARAQFAPQSLSVNEVKQSQAQTTPKQIIELSEDKSQSIQTDVAKVVQTKPLSPERLKELAVLLPPMRESVSKPIKFEAPSYTRHPPHTSDVIKLEFPPKTSDKTNKPSRISQSPLKILRVSHKGAVSSVAALTITFNQAMVPVTSAEVSNNVVPVKLSPLPPGVWHWLSTDTLEFRPTAKRFPNATTFKVAVSPGTTSLVGAKLTSAYQSLIETPAPRVEAFYLAKRNWDTTAISLAPVLVLKFNQPIDPAKTLQYVHAFVGNEKHQLRLATPDEIKKDAVGNIISDAMKTKCLFMRPTSDLPKNIQIQVIVAPGISSNEGPNAGHERQSFSFRTYSPFSVSPQKEEIRPIWQGENNRIDFSNELDMTVCRSSMFTVDPPVKNFKVQVENTGVFFQGDFRMGVTNTIRVSNMLRDIYGQYLSGTHAIRYRMAPRPASLSDPLGNFGQIVPRAKPVYHVLTFNEPAVKISIYEARLSDLQQFENAMKKFSEPKSRVEQLFSSFKLLSKRLVRTDAHTEVWNDTAIDLVPVLKNGATHFIMVVETSGKGNSSERYAQWVEYSPIRMSVFDDGKNLVAMVTDIRTGKPVSGAELVLLPRNSKQSTDKNGLTKFLLDNDKQSFLACHFENQTTILPHSGGWKCLPENGRFVSYQNTDRNLYRPGETVHVNGLLRWVDWDKNGELTTPNQLTEVTYTVKSSDSTELAKGQVKIDKNGGFAFYFAVPQIVELGYCEVSLTAVGSARRLPASRLGEVGFQVQEFRRPEFELALSSNKSNMILGDVASLTATGNYRTGNPLPHAKVHWNVRSRTAYFKPKGLDGYSFDQSRRYNSDGSDNVKNEASAVLDGLSDVAGTDILQIKCKSLARIEPVTLTVEATVQDVNRQEWSQSTSVLVHPADVYVGVKPAQKYFTPQDPKTFDFVVSDLEGNVQPNYSVSLSASKLSDHVDKKTNKLVETLLQEIVVTSAGQAKSCTFDFDKTGEYWITALVTDRQGRVNRSRSSVQVLSAEQVAESNKRDKFSEDQHLRDIELKLNKEKFVPGESAELSIKAPFKGGHGVLVVRGGPFLDVVPFAVDDQVAKILLPIRDTFYPQVEVEVHMVGANSATGFGEIEVDVPPDPVALQLKAVAEADSYQPGQSVKIKVSLQDAKGNSAANGQVAIAVVDESILALTDYKWVNPLSIFYFNKEFFGEVITEPDLINSDDLKPQYISARPKSELASLPPPSAMPPPPLPAPAEGKAGGLVPPPPPRPYGQPGHGLVGAPVDPRYGQSNEFGSPVDDVAFQIISREGQQQVKFRSDLTPLAYFNPAVLTDADGTATVSFVLPGNLTRYRIMAVAVKGAGQFGSSESNFTASLPLMVRPSAPRFLNFKDECEIPFVVQNSSSKPMNAELIVRATNLVLDARTKGDTNLPAEGNGAVAPPGGLEGANQLAGRSFEIPANDRVEIRLPVVANSGAEAIVQVASFAGVAHDATEVTIPLQPPVTAEAFATYGQIDDGAIAQKIVVPANVIKEVGGLEITTSSTAMQQLFDAGEYLKNYPFSCSEQLSSQILGLGGLKDLVSQFQSETEIKAGDFETLQVKDVTELSKRQQSDGGFGLWTRDEPTKWPFVSIQCARALLQSSKHGMPVPQRTLELCKQYLRKIEDRIPTDYGVPERISLAAYALNVRLQMNDPDPEQARQLMANAVHPKKSAQKSTTSNSTTASEQSLQELLPRVMSLESMAWLLPVLAADRKSAEQVQAIQNILAENISETSSTANVNGSPYQGHSYLMYYSPSRLNAVILEALIASKPDSNLIPKMVKGLLLQRRNGRWSTTQENAYSLLALSKYFATYEKVTPDFNAQFWLGEVVSSEEKFAGRSLVSKTMNIPMEFLQSHTKDELLTLAKEGLGRLYYRIGMKYAPQDLKLPATSRGFTVERTYTPVDADSDVTRDAAGVLHVKAGSTVKVTIKIDAPGTRYHVAMTDPFPAGFEALNPATVGTRSVPENLIAPNSPGDLWRLVWFDHQNFRDNQAEAFSSILYSGQCEYTYFAHATTPGTFIVPPCKVEEMYSPETFGRTATEVIVIN